VTISRLKKCESKKEEIAYWAKVQMVDVWLEQRMPERTNYKKRGGTQTGALYKLLGPSATRAERLRIGNCWGESQIPVWNLGKLSQLAIKNRKNVDGLNQNADSSECLGKLQGNNSQNVKWQKGKLQVLTASEV